MNEQETIQYLANVVHAILIDNKITSKEEELLNSISREVGGSYYYIDKAVEYHESPDYKLVFPFRYSFCIRNFEDILRALLSDKKYEHTEKQFTKQIAKEIPISQSQFDRIYKEAKESLL
ncbi:MAG: hypothetical protein GY749_23065 [Desulfobacteraceae bacterium]|nr:hypothetical protein [Desulfobacteraceae bacterium]